MVIGMRVQKRFTDGFEYENRYWVEVAGLADAGDFVIPIAEMEALIHCQYATIYNVHTWVPNQTKNQKRNYPINVVGEFGASGMLRPQIVARVFFTTPETSNPMYKDYRCRVASGELANGTWGATYLAALADFKADMDASGIPFCTTSGDLLGEVTPANQYEFRQLSKRWYNRPTTP